MPVANYKYTYSFPNTKYSIELWFGEEDSFSTPTEIELDEETAIDLVWNGESDSPFGLSIANQAELTLKLDKFTNVEQVYFLNGAIENTTLNLFTSSTLYDYNLTEFPCLNVLKIINDGVTEFIGVQEVQETISTDENGYFKVKFTCLIAKALQLFPFKIERSEGSASYSYFDRYFTDQGIGVNYNNTKTCNYLVDNYYTTSIVNAVVVRDEVGRNQNYYVTTFKNLFEVLSGFISTIISLWLRASNTFTFNNPLNYIKFYRLDGASTMLKGTLLSENHINFIYKRGIVNNIAVSMSLFGESSILNYDSWWEFLREFTSNYYIRSKIDYSTLTVSHLPIKDLSDEVTITGEVGVEGDYNIYEWVWNESNMSLRNSTKFTYPKGQPYENEQIDVSYTNKGNGNLRRLEFNLDFHNVPITTSNHRHNSVWNATDNNFGAIGYIASLDISEPSASDKFVRVSDYCEIKRDDVNYYAPTEQTNTVSLPNAKNDNVGGVVAANYLEWRNTRLSNTTIPTIVNYMIMNYLRNASASFEFQTDQDVLLSKLNGTITFSDFSFLPENIQVLDDFGWISKIEKSVNGLTKLGVTITT